MAVTYSKVVRVTFSDTGLPQGTNWSVTLSASVSAVVLATPSVSTSSIRWSDGNSTVIFYVSNGSYSFAVRSDAGFGATPSNGTLSVQSTPLVVPLAFDRVFTLAFSETGLAPGTNWSVTLNGVASDVVLARPLGNTSLTRWSGGARTILFYVSNGSFYYSAAATAYSNTSGDVTVSGQSISEVILPFTSTTYSTSGPPIFDFVIIAVVIVGAEVGLLAILRHRRGKGPLSPGMRLSKSSLGSADNRHPTDQSDVTTQPK